jgi:hypothetical protein
MRKENRAHCHQEGGVQLRGYEVEVEGIDIYVLK